jgi:membrane-associated phospholipid phosphatase
VAHFWLISSAVSYINKGSLSWRFITIWLVLTVAALWLDQPIAGWVIGSGLDLVVKFSRTAQLIKSLGTISFTVALMLLIWFLSPGSPGKSFLLGASAAVSGFFYCLVKWAIGRSRPIRDGVLNPHPFQIYPFDGGLAGLLTPKSNQSFPSGHVSLAFATATIMAIYFPRWRFFFFGLACLVAVERVLEGAHYFSDVLAGSGLGMMAASCAAALCRRYFGANALDESIRVGSRSSC